MILKPIPFYEYNKATYLYIKADNKDVPNSDKYAAIQERFPINYLDFKLEDIDHVAEITIPCAEGRVIVDIPADGVGLIYASRLKDKLNITWNLHYNSLTKETLIYKYAIEECLHLRR